MPIQQRLDLFLSRLIPTERQRLLALTILSGALTGASSLQLLAA